MRKLLYTLAAVLVSHSLMAQSTTENYIKSTTYHVETTDGEHMAGTATDLAPEDKIESLTYFDGLGRPYQSISARSGGQGQDIITPFVYDSFGRQVKDYLPFSRTGSSLLMESSLLPDANGNVPVLDAFYGTRFPNEWGTGDTPNPFSQKELEASPLNRLMEQAAPGRDWALGNGHTIKFGYGTNATGEVRLFRVTFLSGNTEAPQLAYDGHYTANELYKTITKDENWTSGTDHTTEEFKDKQGRVLLKRTYAQVNGTSTPHDTHYIYDDYGNLTYVLSPEGSDKILNGSNVVQDVLDGLCYQYRYDHRNRLVEKKIPGKDWEHIIYNKLDQPVMTRDMMLYQKKNVLFTNYDAFGRVAYTGMLQFSAAQVPRSILQGYADGLDPITVSKTEVANAIDGTTIHYTQLPLPNDATVEDLFTINYYDDYSFDMPGITAPSDVFGIAPSTRTKGLPTGSKIRVLDTADWITTVTWYDEKGRAICTVSKNPYLGTTDTVKMELDFTGKVIRTESTHKKDGNAPIVVTELYTYDHVGRLLTQTHQIGNDPIELIVANHYDDLGQLDSKKVGGSSAVQPEQSNGLQTVDYSYNIRGWLKAINDPTSLANHIFAFGLSYNTVAYGGDALFNGNISETEWRTANTDSSLKWYTYQYDALNRIKNAKNTSNSHYDLSNVAYDKNGNITYLERRGHTNINGSGVVTSYGVMDQLDYDYYPNSNQLKAVQELSGGNSLYGFRDGSTVSTEYAYDANGNMLTDLNKGIDSDISYGHLNLPTFVPFGGDENISYVYDATGTKLRKTVVEGNKPVRYTYYAGNYVYENGYLKFFGHPEGYVEAQYNGIPDPGGDPWGDAPLPDFGYVYQYKDHLGNVRLSYSERGHNGNGTEATTEIFSDDFETASGWDGSGASWGDPITEFDDAFKYEGNYSGRIDRTGPASVAVHSTTWTAISNSKATVYIYSGWAYSNGPGIRLGLAMKQQGETGYLTLFDDIKSYSKNTWVYIKKYIIVPSHIVSLNLRIEAFDGSPYYGSVWWDNVSIQRVHEVDILEENNYYPFGLEHKGYNNVVNGVENNYFNYNGKEVDKSLGLNWIDFGWRNYDASLGRWMNIDPHSENYFTISPYNSFANNPISFVDPDGRDLLFWQKNDKGKWVQVEFSQLSEETQKALEAFAQTDSGKSFLADFANEGDKIGDVEFDKTGKYAKHELSFGEHSYYGDNQGSAEVQLKDGDNKLTLEWIWNKAYNYDMRDEGVDPIAYATVNFGHEAFIHFTQYIYELLDAFDRGDMTKTEKLLKTHKDNSREITKKDHGGFLDNKPEYKQMRAYLTQLKNIINPQKVNRAMVRQKKALNSLRD